MKRIYLLTFLAVWMFAACSSNEGMVKTDGAAMETPMETTMPAETKGDMSASEEASISQKCRRSIPSSRRRL